MNIKDLIFYLSDDKERTYFTSDDYNNYIDINEYTNDLINFIENEDVLIKDQLKELVSLLDIIINDTELSEIYIGNGKILYKDKNGNDVNDTQLYFKDYIKNSNEWEKAIILAKKIYNELK